MTHACAWPSAGMLIIGGVTLRSARRALVVAVLLSACAGIPAGPARTTVSTPPQDRSLLDGAFDAARGLLPFRDQEALASRMGATGDVRWVPYLMDLLRLSGSERFSSVVQSALHRLTGVEAPSDALDAYNAFGAWMLAAVPDPGPDYIRFKGIAYGRIDPELGFLLGQVSDPVLASRLQWGGVSRGGIPEINDPKVIPVAEAGHMAPDELVFGAVHQGEARAYPLRILDFNELANDSLGGEPVALANCTLCRTGILFSRKVGARVLDFETSGLLLNSNKVMVDKQTSTLWEHLSGKALAGPLKGSVLRRLSLTVTTWSDWLATHPASGVLAIPNGVPYARYSYEPGRAYAQYYASQQLWFPVLSPPPVFPPKAEVATLELGGSALAVEVSSLVKRGAVALRLAGRPVLAVATAHGARFYEGEGPVAAGPSGLTAAGAPVTVTEDELRLPDGRSLPRLTSGQSFWFAWFTQHPDTEWWPRAGGT